MLRPASISTQVFPRVSFRTCIQSIRTMTTLTEEDKAFSNFDIDKSSAVISNDPSAIYKEYDHLRQHCPMVWTNQYGGYWLMTRYEDVKRAAADSSTYISSVKAVVPSDPRGIRRPPLNFDAPAHTPFRTALERTLKPSRLKRIAPALEKHSEDELRPLLEAGGGDISAQFGANFVAWVEAEWLNLEPEIAPKLAQTAAAWLNAWRMRDAETTTTNSMKMYDIARALLADRREEPRDPEEDPVCLRVIITSWIVQKG
jgi:cytochrome P450